MKIAAKLSFAFFIFASLCSVLPLTAEAPAKISAEEAAAIATDAYIYFYPLITMDMTRQVMTNVATAGENRAPMGQFAHALKYPSASFRDVTAPNADTLYSIAWLDLSKEPYILQIPDQKERYYLMPALSAWTEVFADPGKRTTGDKAAIYAFTGPQWTGTLPPNVKEFKSPTNLVWILGRTYCTGTAIDYAAVHALQKKYLLTPLSAFGKPYTPPRGVVDSKIDMKTSVRTQVNKLDALAYFTRAAELLKKNPPVAADSAMIEKIAKIGIIPGKDFEINRLDKNVIEGLKKAPALGIEKILVHEKEGGKIVNGWLVTTKTGQYGTDYLQRALITAIGLGANLPQDAIYPMTSVDAEANQLIGVNRYLLHFNKDQIPPVQGFWSLTMYNNQYFFAANPLNRFTLSPRDKLKYNPDGSLDLYLQHGSPGKEKESNWLPAPPDKFILMLRLYWPDDAVINGTWQPPAVQKIK